jgi:hypothetical protein
VLLDRRQMLMRSIPGCVSNMKIISQRPTLNAQPQRSMFAASPFVVTA